MAVDLKFFADESVEKRLVLALRHAYVVDYVAEILQGTNDELVLATAEERKRVLLTADKDFGDLVYQGQRLHTGIILYRLHGLSIDEKISLVLTAVEKYGVQLINSFTVITPTNVRIRKQ